MAPKSDLPALRSTLLTVRGAALHLVEAGRGPPVLLLHGLSASSHVFRALMERGAARHRFVAVDLPCSGRSGQYSAMAPEALADAMASLLRKRSASPAVVVGHSFGGMVALELLARHPRSVRGLVLVSVPALGMGDLAPLLDLPFASRVWGGLGRLLPSPPLVHGYLKLIWGASRGPTKEMVTRYVEAARAEGYAAAMFEALRHVGKYRMPVEALRRAKAPRAVLWGELDRLVPILQGEQVALAAGVPLTVLEGAGHCVPEERPEALEAAIDALLKRRPRATAPGARTRRRRGS